MSRALATLEDGPALVPEVDSEDRKSVRHQFQLVLALEKTEAFTPVHFEVPDDITFETAEAVANWLGGMKRRTSWYIGDLLLKCEAVHGELYAQVAHATGLAEQTLMNLVWTAKAIPPERRVAGVSFGCHQLVSALSAREQRTWLTRCLKGGWTVAMLREQMRARRIDTKPELFDDDEQQDARPDAQSAVEVLRAILRDAKEHYDPAFVLVPVETMARARAALGEA